MRKAIQRKGIELASKCDCCSQPTWESFNHVFITSCGPRIVWQFFESLTGIHSSASTISARINEWWLMKFRSPCYRTLLKILPVCTCWEIWKARNYGRFEGKALEVGVMVRNIKEAVAVARCWAILLQFLNNAQVTSKFLGSWESGGMKETKSSTLSPGGIDH